MVCVLVETTGEYPLAHQWGFQGMKLLDCVKPIYFRNTTEIPNPFQQHILVIVKPEHFSTFFLSLESIWMYS